MYNKIVIQLNYIAVKHVFFFKTKFKTISYKLILSSPIILLYEQCHIYDRELSTSFFLNANISGSLSY